MKRIFLGLLACAAVPAFAELDYDTDAVRAHCEREWGDDFAMRQFCEDEAEQGFLNFLALRKQAQDGGIGTKSADNCAREWDPNYAMTAYCVEQQLVGLLDYAEVLTSLPKDIADRIATHCSKDWKDDYAMLAYCAAEQAEAWLDLQ